jgi:1,4-dihydroxy-2-naphthoyl-CoA synthase
MALMFTAPWHLFATPRVHVDFAKERQISILHYSPGSALLPKIGQSQAADCWYMCRLFFRHFCWEAAEQKGWHQVLAKIRSFKEGEAASCTEISN